jgi:hypothetical protein
MIQKRKNGGRGETRTPDPLLAKLGEIKIQVVVQAALNTTTPPEKTSQAAPKVLQEFKPPIVSRSCLSDLDQRLGVEQPADSSRLLKNSVIV